MLSKLASVIPGRSFFGRAEDGLLQVRRQTPGTTAMAHLVWWLYLIHHDLWNLFVSTCNHICNLLYMYKYICIYMYMIMSVYIYIYNICTYIYIYTVYVLGQVSPRTCYIYIYTHTMYVLYQWPEGRANIMFFPVGDRKVPGKMGNPSCLARTGEG